MFDFHRLAMFGAVLCGVVLMLPGANAIELSGAWATDAELCNRVFTKKGNGIEFAELSDLSGSGFNADDVSDLSTSASAQAANRAVTDVIRSSYIG